MFGGMASFGTEVHQSPGRGVRDPEEIAYGYLEEGEDGPGYEVYDFAAVEFTVGCGWSAADGGAKLVGGANLRGATVMGPVARTESADNQMYKTTSRTDQLRSRAGKALGVSTSHLGRKSLVDLPGTDLTPAFRSRLTRQTCPQSGPRQWHNHLHRGIFNQPPTGQIQLR
jgi:hypothetical protein